MRTFIAALISVSLLAFAFAQDESTAARYLEPSPFYEQIKDRLTPLEAVMPGIEAFEQSDKPGIFLLNERFEIIVSATERYSVQHYIQYTKLKAGIDGVGKNTVRYRKNQEEPHLVLARTIQPDGSEIAVANNAIFTQSPQDTADSDLYTDYEELVIIFPNIDVGSVTESIVVVKEFEPIIAEEAVYGFTFRFNWPIYRTHYQLEVPDAFADRLRRSTMGPNVPETQIEKRDGRTRYTYIDQQRQANVWETKREPATDTGPLVRYSTFATWDDVGNWIRSLVSERSELDDSLKAEIDTWTDGLSERDEIIQAILDRVANEVRYTGLEFGIAGYQPYDCNIVWANKYGDCKDKSNLLAAALRYKGIPAHIALIDTDNLGKFDTSHPSPFYFNHAITAVENGDGTHTFIDPTVEEARLYELPNGNINRNAVIISDDATLIEKTPLVRAGDITFDFDLTLAADLTTSGFHKLVGSGYYASYYINEYEELSPQALKWTLHERIAGYYPGAKTSDATAPSDPAPGSPIATAYFVLKNQNAASETFSFKLPEISWILPNTGEPDTARVTEFQIDPTRTVVELSLKLPPNMTIQSLPSDITHSTKDYRYNGKWRQERGSLSGSFELIHYSDRITPDDFATFQEHVAAVERWWATPATLTSVDSVADLSIPDDNPFPKLSSASAQLALLDKLYPSDGDKDKRRQALDQVIEWFPEDSKNLFSARMQRVRLDEDILPAETIASTIRDILRTHGDATTPSLFAWGEFLLAQQLDELDQDEEALALFEKHLGDLELGSYRRGWSAYNAAFIYEELGQLEKAVTVLLKESTYESDALNTLAASLLRIRSQQASTDAIAGALAHLEKNHTASFQRIVNHAVTELENENSLSDGTQLDALQQALNRYYDSYSNLDDAKNALVRIAGQIELASQLDSTAKTLKRYIKRERPDWYYDNTPQRKVTESSLLEMIKETETSNDWRRQAALSLDYLFQYTENRDLAAQYFYWAIWDFAYKVDDRDFENLIVDELLKMPPVGDHMLNAYISAAKGMATHKDYEYAGKIMKRYLSFESNPASSTSIAKVRYAEILEEAGDAAEAIRYYLAGGVDHHSNYRVYKGLLRAHLLALEQGNYDDARQALELMAAGDTENLSEAGVLEQFRRLHAMANDPEYQRAYWEKAENLRAAALNVLEQLKYKRSDLEDSLPVLEDSEALSDTITKAREDNDVPAFHKKLIQLLLAATTNEADLETAAKIIAEKSKSDRAVIQLNKPVAELAAFAAFEGDYLKSEPLKRLVLRLHTIRKDEAAAAQWAIRILKDKHSTPQTLDYAAAFCVPYTKPLKPLRAELYQLVRQRYDSGEMRKHEGTALYRLADHYTAIGSHAKAKRHFQMILEHPRHSQDETLAKFARRKLKDLQSVTLGNEDLETLLSEVTDINRFPWLSSLPSYSEENLYRDGERIDHSNFDFYFKPKLERAKIHFEISKLTSLRQDERVDSLIRGIVLLVNTELYASEFFPFLIRTAKINGISKRQRSRVMEKAIRHLMVQRDHKGLAEILSDETLLDPETREETQNIVSYLQMPADTVAQIEAAILHLIQSPFGDLEATLLEDALFALTVRFGEPASEPVKRSLTALDAWDKIRSSSGAKRLKAVGAIAVASRVHEVYPFLFPEVTAAAGDTPESNPGSTILLRKEDQLSSLRYHLKHPRKHNYKDTITAALNYRSEANDPTLPDDLKRYYEAANRLPMTPTRKSLVRLPLQAVDTDLPAYRKAMLDGLKQFLTDRKDANVADQYNALLFSAGKNHTDPQHKLSQSGVPESDQKYDALAMLIESYHSEDAVASAAIIREMPDALLSWHTLLLGGYASLGDSDHAALLAAQAHKQNSDRQNFSLSVSRLDWSTQHKYLIIFPEEREAQRSFYETAVALTENERCKAHLQVSLSLANSDWDAVIRDTRFALENWPSWHDLHFVLGYAYHETGQHELAATSLETYLEHRPNSVIYPLVRRFQKASAPTPDALANRP